MEVEAVIWYWTPGGMRNAPALPQMGMGLTRYIEASQVERLLEDAHRRGAERMREICENEIRRA